MDYWSELIDSFLSGLVLGLGISIAIALCVFEIDLYRVRKANEIYVQEQEELFEQYRLEVEGWLQNED